MVNSIPCLRQKSRKTYPGWPHVPIKPPGRTRQQIPALLRLNIFPETKHYFLLRNSCLLETAVLLFSLFISEISPSDTRGKLSFVYCHCSCILLNKMRIFEGGNTSALCSGVSVGWMFTSVCRGCWKAISIKQCCGGVNFI